MTTTEVSDISGVSAIGGGNITSDGGIPITSVAHAEYHSNPTISDSKTIDGTGTGNYSSSIKGLTPGTTYYIRAYATNNIGTAYGNVLLFKSLSIESMLKCIEAFPGIVGEIISTSLNGNQVTCSKINGELVFQGDIILSSPTKSAALESQNTRWPNNTVYYSVNSNFKNTSRIADAIKEYEGKPILSFMNVQMNPTILNLYMMKVGAIHS